MADLTKIPGLERGFDPEKFIEHTTPMGSANPENDFYEKLLDCGYKVPDGRIALDTLVRIPSPSDDNDHSKTGWYVFKKIQNEGFDTAFGWGMFGDWRTGEEHTFKSKADRYMTDSEMKQISISQRKAREDYEQKKKEQWAISSAKAAEVFNDLADPQPPSDHPYILKKKIKPRVARYYNGKIVIPIINSDHKIISYQSIDNDGEKRFLGGAKKKGGFCYIRGEDDVIYICEGWATGCTIAELTGKMVYIAFDAGNLEAVAPVVHAKHSASQIVVAGDNDIESEKKTGINRGVKSATDAARLISGYNIISPVESDFNDAFIQLGAEKTLDALAPPEEKPLLTPEVSKTGLVRPEPPDGIIKAIYSYYMSMARSPNPVLGIQAALAACSVVLGRCYHTNQNNFTAMFFCNVAPSGFGKEDVHRVIKNLMKEWDIEDDLSGSGYTGSGAVSTELIHRPRCITIIDEFGDYISTSKRQLGGQQQAATEQLRSAIGLCDSVYKPTNYSSGSAAGTKAGHKNDKKVYNPSLTLLGTTTPREFYDAIGDSEISNGFLNRFLFAIVNGKRPRKRNVDIKPIPEPIIKWGKEVLARGGNQFHDSSQEPIKVLVEFFPNCLDLLNELDDYEFAREEVLSEHALEEMTRRVREWAMRLSLIVALAENPQAQYVDRRHLQWASDYVRFSHEVLCQEMIERRAGSKYESQRRELVLEIDRHKSAGLSRTKLNHSPAFKKHPKKFREEILEDAISLGEIVTTQRTPIRGKPATYYHTPKWLTE